MWEEGLRDTSPFGKRRRSEIDDEQILFVRGSLGEDHAPRVERHGDSGEVAIRVDLIDDQDKDAVVVGAGRDVPKPAGSLLSSGFRPGRSMGHEDDLRTGESLDSRGFGEVRVVTDLYADDCVLQAKDRQVASVSESADLARGDMRLAVRVEAASRACDQLCVVEDARGRALEHSGEDHDVELVRQRADSFHDVALERTRELARDVSVGWVTAK